MLRPVGVGALAESPLSPCGYATSEMKHPAPQYKGQYAY